MRWALPHQGMEGAEALAVVASSWNVSPEQSVARVRVMGFYQEADKS